MSLKNKGFTLVELMVVVAIIGLLSAVAIPNFQKYQSKAKASEAKLQLSALYMTEQSFSMDYNVYAQCLNIMGYDPSKEFASRYYSIGFGAANDTANTAAVDNGQAPAACNANAGSVWASGGAVDETVSLYAYNAGKGIDAATISTSAWLNAAHIVGATPHNTFTAGAVGVISSAKRTNADADYWTINENKVITQTRVGY